jgi:ribA/ribD-fused uncharacterized protein
MAKVVKKPTQDQIIAFWRPIDPHGYLGQWYKSEFILTNNMIQKFPDAIKALGLWKDKQSVLMKLAEQGKFQTAEMFMMMGKAALFEDDDVFTQIGRTSDPKNHKALGRKVKNFSDDIWNKYALDIVKIGNYLKFSQSDELITLIKASGNSILVEASPYDKIWGIGMRPDHPDVINKTKWKGSNYLGECLMFIRNII